MARTHALLWTAVLVVALSIPGDDLPELTSLALDKPVHVVLFAVLGFLWLRVYPRAALRLLIAGLVFAVLTEVYQHVVPIDRVFSLYDALADGVGFALGLGIGLWRQKRQAVAV